MTIQRLVCFIFVIPKRKSSQTVALYMGLNNRVGGYNGEEPFGNVGLESLSRTDMEL